MGKGKPLDKGKLSERERCFVELYMGSCKGNGTRAAIEAGYSKKTARGQASRLLTKANIRHAIEARIRSDPKVMSRQELQEFWSAIAMGRGYYVTQRLRERLRASELLARSHKMLTDRHEVDAGPGLLELLRAAGLGTQQQQKGGGQ